MVSADLAVLVELCEVPLLQLDNPFCFCADYLFRNGKAVLSPGGGWVQVTVILAHGPLFQ